MENKFKFVPMIPIGAKVPQITINWYDYKENEKEIQDQLIYEYGYNWINIHFISWEVW